MNYTYKEYGPSGSFINPESFSSGEGVKRRYRKMQAVIYLMELLMHFDLKTPWNFMTTPITTNNPRYHQFKKDGKWRVTIY